MEGWCGVGAHIQNDRLESAFLVLLLRARTVVVE
jgi:hypothetical protein